MPDASAIWLTLTLAGVTTTILLLLGTPLAWWLATTRSPLKPAVEAVTALPLVLPPTVIGFYLLVLLSPSTPLGGLWVTLTGDALTFSLSSTTATAGIRSTHMHRRSSPASGRALTRAR